MVRRQSRPSCRIGKQRGTHAQARSIGGISADVRARILWSTTLDNEQGKPQVTTASGRSYAGDITPEQAWKMLSENPEAVLVDVRTDAEWRFVGVPDLASLGREVVYIKWNAADGNPNENFVADLLEHVPTGDDRPVVFLCRSGNRSIGAAGAATAADRK